MKQVNENQEYTAQIRNAAIRLLAQREHSQRELIRKLEQKGFLTSDIHFVVEELADEGLQSQQRYCEMLLRARVVKGYGRNKISQELDTQGIDNHTCQICLEECDVDWFELCKSQKLKKFGEGALSDWKLQQKCRRFLYQRGFNEEQIRYAMES